MNTGIGLIENERMRQVLQKRYTPTHDDQHTLGELTYAAMEYALQETRQLKAPGTTGEQFGELPWWPWEWETWKPEPDPIRNLVKAGALIAAEIDRLLRARDAALAPASGAPVTGRE